MTASVFFLCVFLLRARPSAGRVSDFHGNPGKIKDGSPRFMGEETESSELESTLPRGRAAGEQLSRDLKPIIMPDSNHPVGSGRHSKPAQDTKESKHPLQIRWPPRLPARPAEVGRHPDSAGRC